MSTEQLIAVLQDVSPYVALGSILIYRINQLERKVEKHNNLIERMYKVEARVGVLEKEE